MCACTRLNLVFIKYPNYTLTNRPHHTAHSTIAPTTTSLAYVGLDNDFSAHNHFHICWHNVRNSVNTRMRLKFVFVAVRIHTRESTGEKGRGRGDDDGD